jgi:Raf kinase inhibitor-like YbhB/YbcL family protein
MPQGNSNTHLAHPPAPTDDTPSPEHSGAAITILKVQPFEGGSVVLTSDAVDLDGRLDPVHAQDGDNTSPPLSWTMVPDAEAYALVVEDPDAPREEPVLHWAMWDIPGGVTSLPAGVAVGARVDGLPGAVQGRNSHGEAGWMGPKPPKGHGPHRYYFQLFALGRRLGMGPEATLVELTGALKGDTVASTQLVATFETPDDGVGG